MFIYKITNKINGKLYIGQTTQNPSTRWSQHKHSLNNGKCNNNHLQRAWNKYGQTNFLFEVLDSCETLDELNELEKSYIQQYNSNNISVGYNIRIGGDSGGKLSNTTKKKISASRMGISPWNKGKKLKPLSKKARLQRSIKQRRKFKVYPNLVSPDGKIYKIDTVKGFCKTHGLYHRRIFAVLFGEAIQHKGWHLEKTDLSLVTKAQSMSVWRLSKIPRHILSPDGIIYRFTNLSEFCKVNGLSAGKVSELFTGKRKIHKGWTAIIH